MLKIFIAMPTYKFMQPETNSTISKLIQRGGFEFEYCNRRGSPNIYLQHAGMCNEFLKGNYDYYLWFDSDQTVENPDNWLDLLVNADKPIISPLITRKVYPFIPACYTRGQHRALQEGRQMQLVDFRLFGPEPFEVFYSCGGVVLIKREVLTKIRRKYMNPFYASFDKRGHQCGVDISLYMKAREAGFSCWIDPRIECAHVGDYPFLPSDYYSLLDAGVLGKTQEMRA